MVAETFNNDAISKKVSTWLYHGKTLDSIASQANYLEIECTSSTT